MATRWTGFCRAIQIADTGHRDWKHLRKADGVASFLMERLSVLAASGRAPDLLLRKGFLVPARPRPPGPGPLSAPRPGPLSILSLTDRLFRCGGASVREGWESSEEQLFARSSLEKGEQRGAPLGPPRPPRRGVSGAGIRSSGSSGSDSVWLSSASLSGPAEGGGDGSMSQGGKVVSGKRWAEHNDKSAAALSSNIAPAVPLLPAMPSECLSPNPLVAVLLKSRPPGSTVSMISDCSEESLWSGGTTRRGSRKTSAGPTSSEVET
ncbi:hypothetical protein INR49_006068 [Caranx melampygus]|nr:hypothetical protein INR49_006068 [Caranx melampygus]